MRELQQLSERVLREQRDGTITTEPTREQRIQWAYGQTAISNPDVTTEHATAAVDGLDEQRTAS